MVVFAKTNGRCFYCNRPAEHIDHFISRCKWKIWDLTRFLNKSVDNLSNLFPACARCNLRKGFKDPEDFMGNSYKLWARYNRANRRVGLPDESPYVGREDPFDHYEWLTFMAKYG